MKTNLCFRLTYTAAVLICLCGQAIAAALPSFDEAAGRYAIQPSSRIGFTVEQVGGGAGIRGTFGKFSGTFNLQAGDISRSTVTFTLIPDSVETGQQRIDTFLKSTAVFDTGSYATISFRSTGIAQTASDTATVTGELTAKGHKRTETFNVKLTRWDGARIAFQVTGGVFRSRYAKDVGTPIYSNVVQFNMSIEGARR
ncbi:YceI family protein [Rhizobium sp. RM]|uniref:YceI family protein n=1 Tax=Rhizobium sp. RM TaxID=2748079 RepID=UPI00110E95F1|nr:YceI family protein [Rhizobium sp. RM]NWJ24287.1 polyisoprenoid-binding protein [Rhizobium sp. RM]TMV21158.1 polyisoprenoid-binding protein [Rhizobium sp. Td3]